MPKSASRIKNLTHATLAFVTMPGVVAYAIPLAWAWYCNLSISRPVGLLACLMGTLGLISCTVEFLVRGKGTLAPWKPPGRLVSSGLYRWTRNPMYLCVCTVIMGWGASFNSRALVGYAVVLAAVFHLRVVFGEEPWLERIFPEQWPEYRRSVPRWLSR